MAFRDEYEFDTLVNEAERIVKEQLELQLAKSGGAVCKCQDCVLDMAALALNKVQPQYRVSLLGTLYAHALDGSEYEKSVISEVKRAIGKIAENPSH